MSETCHPGIAYILQLYTEEQSRVDTALTHNVCHTSKEDGMIGMSKFDYALVFTDMKKFFPAMSGALDVKQIFNIENWQNLLKC